MAILPGRRLGPYEILSAIGAGGMGEVYRARDTRLDRIVAIKVLTADLADRPELRERFDREARTIASLNHPHICVLHDIGQQDGIDYLVMEYVEGDTLAERVSRGPLPLDQALRYAIEIADALDKAHRRGVTHRDLKPGNIMLTKSGAKLLDFGLAKLKQDAGFIAPLSRVRTATDPITAKGTILGTLQYMAPEQLESKDVDARADIFAFGAVLYEMVTGRRAFDGQSQASIIAAIIDRDPPPPSALQPMTPSALDRVVKRCLAKDRDDRWQTARDVAAELKWIAESDASVAPPQAAGVSGKATSGRRPLFIATGALLIGAALAGLAVWNLTPAPALPPPAITRLLITLPPGERLPADQAQRVVALSPDGDQLAYIAVRDGRQQLFVRAMDSLDARAFPGTDGARSPFFSPDGQWIGFDADGKLKKVPVGGGAVATITGVGGLSGASWGSSGTILFADLGGGGGGPLFQVPADGGVARPLIAGGKDQVFGSAPEFLPGGRAIVYVAQSGPYSGGGRLLVRSLDTGAERTLAANTGYPRYVPSGHLVYWRAGALIAAPFDPASLQLTGAEVPVVENVLPGEYSVSRTGSLAYVTGAAGTTERRMLWVNRSGARQPLDSPVRAYDSPQISPDGRKVAVEIGPQTWIYDLERGALTRLAFEGAVNDSPIWSPDGKRIAVRSDRAGTAAMGVFWQLADGGGGAEPLTDGRGGALPRSFSPDGQVLAYQQTNPGTRRNVFLLRMADRKAEPFLTTPAMEGAAKFSPDGRWLAYVSDESGRLEVYVQPFPPSGSKWQVSTEGGTEPAWNRNGRELFYRSGPRMMAVDVETQPTFSPGKARILFEGQYLSSQFPLTGFAYDVVSDGQRFLMIEETGQGTASPEITVVLNWIEELKRRVPPKAN